MREILSGDRSICRFEKYGFKVFLRSLRAKIGPVDGKGG